MKQPTPRKSTFCVATFLSLALISFTAPQYDTGLGQTTPPVVSESGVGAGSMVMNRNTGVIEGALHNQKGAVAWKFQGKVQVSSLLPMAQGIIVGELVNSDGKSISFQGKFSAPIGGLGVLGASDKQGTKLFEGRLKLGMSARWSEFSGAGPQ